VRVVEIKEFEEEFVLYFGGKPNRINAYTLASSLVSVADAVKSANSLINPGYDVEVVVEAFGEGSFKVRVKTIFHGAQNLFSKENLKAIVLSVIAAYIYEKYLYARLKLSGETFIPACSYVHVTYSPAATVKT